MFGAVLPLLPCYWARVHTVKVRAPPTKHREGRCQASTGDAERNSFPFQKLIHLCFQLFQYLYPHNTPTNLNGTIKPNLQLEHKGDFPDNAPKISSRRRQLPVLSPSPRLLPWPLDQPLPYPYAFAIWRANKIFSDHLKNLKAYWKEVFVTFITKLYSFHLCCTKPCIAVAVREKEQAHTNIKLKHSKTREDFPLPAQKLWLRFTLQDDNNESNDSN